MIGHFLDYVRSSYLLWIPPIYKYLRKHPFVWLFLVLLLLMLRREGLFSWLFLHWFYPDMLPENRVEVWQEPSSTLFFAAIRIHERN